MIYYLGLGTNQGWREQNLQNAVIQLEQSKEISISKISSIYLSEPVGCKNQSWFLNAVVEVVSTFEPVELLIFIKNLETQLGRIKTFRWGPRIIDIDILSCENLIIKTKKLTIPHSEMHLRKFVLIPLAEIAPNYIHPLKKLTVQQLLKQCLKTKIYWYSQFRDTN